MTIVEIIRKNSSIIKYSAKGHSGYGEYGNDIVCAALSIALQYPLAGMHEILAVYPKFKINNDGYLMVDLKDIDKKNKNREINALLDSMYIILKSLTNEYPKNIKLVEKEEE